MIRVATTNRKWGHSARRALAICLALALVVGCRSPVKVSTDNRIRVVGPVETQVTSDMPPQRNASPVEQMCVANGPVSCGRPVVALIDVDGLLVNANMAGPYSCGENPVAAFREKLDAAAADPNVCGVVIRINTPGS